MSAPLNWIIYTLKNPRTDEVRYVGWTKRTPAKRLRNHLMESVNGPRTYKNRWLFSLLSIGLRPVIETVESGSGDGWAEAEKRWIARFKAAGARLTNATDGGDGTAGRVRTAEERAAAVERWARIAPEQRRAVVEPMIKALTARWASLTAAERSALSKSWQAGADPEKRSRVARDRWFNLPEDQRKAILVAARKSANNRTFEQFSASAKKSAQNSRPRTREEKAASALKGIAKRIPKTKEEWRAIGAKGLAASLKRTFEEKSASAKKGAQNRPTRTFEQFSEISKRSWITRKGGK
jgi:predicted Fe-S protein YdhL (DUF1289 family)